MEYKITANNGSDSGVNISLSESVFGREYNEDLIHQVVTAYRAAGRSGSKAQKTRSQVRGGGAKPWRQKGTGRARAGTIRSPIWRGGGNAFAASPRNFEQKVNRKMHQAAMCCILSELVRQERLVVVESITPEAPRTKLLFSRLREMGLSHALVVTPQFDEVLHLSARNIVNVDTAIVNSVGPVSLISHDKVVMTVEAIKKIEELLQ